MSLRSWRPSVTLVRFLTVGLVSYLVNQAALCALYDRLLRGFDATIATPFGSLGGRLLVASILALEVSILVRFVLNDCWTFADHRDAPLLRRFYRFNASSLASPVFALAPVNVLTPAFGISYLLANSLGIAGGLAWNWVCSNRLVWGARHPDSTSTPIAA